MNIKKIIICIACTILFSGCVDENGFVPIQITKTYDNGFSNCVMESLIPQERSYCEELRAYDAQIINKDDSRFDASTYTPEVNLTGSIEGKWMYFAETGQYAGELRQSCELNEQSANPNNFDLTCSENPLTDMVFHSDTNILDMYQTIRTGSGSDDYEDETYELTRTTYGVVSDLNKIEVNIKSVKVWSDGYYVEPSNDYLYTLIRLGDTTTPLGQISVEKYDFEGNLQLAENYDVEGILEKDDVITLSDVAGDTLALFYNGMVIENTDNLFTDIFGYQVKLYGNSYVIDLFPGVDPYLFDGIDTQVTPISPNSPQSYTNNSQFELRLRQFDYVSNDSSSLNIDWLINRRQATRFERGDTIGNISLSF